jgi:hypothetical protein
MSGISQFCMYSHYVLSSFNQRKIVRAIVTVRTLIQMFNGKYDLYQLLQTRPIIFDINTEAGVFYLNREKGYIWLVFVNKLPVRI